VFGIYLADVDAGLPGRFVLLRVGLLSPLLEGGFLGTLGLVFPQMRLAEDMQLCEHGSVGFLW
jgi:hypothetical protein